MMLIIHILNIYIKYMNIKYENSIRLYYKKKLKAVQFFDRTVWQRTLGIPNTFKIFQKSWR